MIDEINRFWFEEIKPAQWWKVDLAFDRQIAERFGAVHRQAERGELESWRATPQGRLAEILVLDQFSRNIWRNTPRAFASDGVALVLAQEAVRQVLIRRCPSSGGVSFTCRSCTVSRCRFMKPQCSCSL